MNRRTLLELAAAIGSLGIGLGHRTSSAAAPSRRNDPHRIPLAMQGASNPTTGTTDFAYWAGQLNMPVFDNTGNYSILFMCNGIGLQGDWDQFAGDAYTSSHMPASDDPNLSKYYPLVPLGSHPPADPSDPTLAQAASGSFNANYANAAVQFIGTGRSSAVWRLMWEWTSDGYPWSYSWPAQDQANYAANFIGAWQQMRAAVRSVMPNSGFVWNLNQDFLTACPIWQDCYPGDDSVDVIGIDTYDQGWMSSVTDPLARFNQFSLPGLQAAAQFAAAHGKQFAVCEWGVGENGDNPVFVRQMAAFLASCPAPVTYHGYYDVGDFDFQNSPQTLAAFIAAFARG
jgi:hypothetical protein